MKAKDFLAAASAIVIAAVGSGSILMSICAVDTDAAVTTKPATTTVNDEGITCFRTEGADKVIVEVSGEANAACSGLVGWYTDDWYQLDWDTEGLDSNGTGSFEVDLSSAPENVDLQLQVNYYAVWNNSTSSMELLTGKPTFTSVTLCFGEGDVTTTTATPIDPTWNVKTITPNQEFDIDELPEDDKMIGWFWSEFGLEEGETVKQVAVQLSVPSGTVGKWQGAFGSSTTVDPEHWTQTPNMTATFDTRTATIVWNVSAGDAAILQTTGSYGELKFGTWSLGNGTVYTVDSVTVYSDKSTVVTTTTTAASTTTTAAETTTTTAVNTTTTTATPDKGLLGDVTLNGKVSLSDVIKLNQYLTGQVTLSPEALELGDFNQSGGLPDSDDVTAIIRFLLKLS